MTHDERNELTGRIIAACIEVHKELGPGLFESVYETCLMIEFQHHCIRAENQVDLPIHYRGKKLDKKFKVDVLAEEEIVLEIKSVETILPVHEQQLLTYLKLAKKRVGLLVNFNVALLKNGIRRKINGYD